MEFVIAFWKRNFENDFNKIMGMWIFLFSLYWLVLLFLGKGKTYFTSFYIPNVITYFLSSNMCVYGSLLAKEDALVLLASPNILYCTKQF
jgi:hypothetical protein